MRGEALGIGEDRDRIGVGRGRGRAVLDDRVRLRKSATPSGEA